jgi:Uma2 family endonuclease
MATITAPEPILDSEPDQLQIDALYEVIGGEVVEKSQMGSYPVEVASTLLENLGPFVRRSGLGRAFNEMLFQIDRTTQFRPDVAFVSHEKWPIGRRSPRRQPWEIVPDVAIEVISETDRAQDVLSKTGRYFQAGVRAVWLIYPDLEVVHVYESFTRIRVLTRDDILDSSEIIPGFQLPLGSLFEGEEAEAEEDARPAD